MDAAILNILKGSSTLIVFVIWFLYHKSSTDQLNKIIDLQLNREKENFNLLKDMIASNLLQNEKLEQIKSLITTNQWCPMHRKYLQEADFWKGEQSEPESCRKTTLFRQPE